MKLSRDLLASSVPSLSKTERQGVTLGPSALLQHISQGALLHLNSVIVADDNVYIQEEPLMKKNGMLVNDTMMRIS